jgi:hypothetical protein
MGGGNPDFGPGVVWPITEWERIMGRYALLWFLGVPIPLLVLIWAFGGLH